MIFDIQTAHLQNNLIRLVPLLETNFEELYNVASNPKVWEQHPNPNRYKREDFKIYFKGAMESKGAFLIVCSKTDEVIGCTRYYDYNQTTNSVLIGYTFIGTKFWGNGFNLALKKLMIDYAFQFVDKVYFHIGAFNIRSQKAIEKIDAIKIDEFEVEYYGETSKLNFVYLIQKN